MAQTWFHCPNEQNDDLENMGQSQKSLKDRDEQSETSIPLINFDGWGYNDDTSFKTSYEGITRQPVAYFTKVVNPRLAKCPLKTNGHLANCGVTSLVKEATGVQSLKKCIAVSSDSLAACCCTSLLPCRWVQPFLAPTGGTRRLRQHARWFITATLPSAIIVCNSLG